MKLWLVKRTDGHDYDEYDALVVRAESEENAKALLGKECWYRANGMHHEHWGNDELCRQVYSGFLHDGSNAEITEILADGEPGLVIGSFNAG